MHRAEARARKGPSDPHQRRESEPRPWTTVHAFASEWVGCRTLPAARILNDEPLEVLLMGRPRTRSMSAIVQELYACSEQQEREIAALRAMVDKLRVEREELLAQVRFATEHANRETRAAGSLRIELLARTSAPKERLDFCGDEHGETTAVLPVPRFVRRRKVRDDGTFPG